MDPLTPAFAFAGVVQLIGLFKQTRDEQSSRQFHEFQAWLAEQNRGDIIELLQNSAETQSQIQQLLQSGKGELLGEIERLSGVLAEVASHSEYLAGLVASMSPRRNLSEQAIDILCQLEKSGANGFIEVRDSAGPELMLFGAGGFIDYSETRFLEDDFEALCSMGMLIYEQGVQSRKFHVTRAGMKFASEFSRR